MFISRTPVVGAENAPYIPVPYLPDAFTTTLRDEIVAPATGYIIFNTTTSKLNVYTGAAWEEITSA
jgi:cephalosporin-C deacetylase-like acetyl esterase